MGTGDLIGTAAICAVIAVILLIVGKRIGNQERWAVMSFVLAACLGAVTVSTFVLGITHGQRQDGVASPGSSPNRTPPTLESPSGTSSDSATPVIAGRSDTSSGPGSLGQEVSWYFLADRPWLSDSNVPGSSSVGLAMANGKSYNHSLIQDHWSFAGESTILFDLERKCNVFTFTAGISDSSPDAGRSVVEVYADKKLLTDFKIGVGESHSETLGVVGALRLKLAFNGPDSRMSLVWGDAKIRCGPLN
jgi:hypothetical protein